ncbi:hypothetical protein A6V36_30280 [Paraburkholderia ginsengiterrae]|uniref:HTH lysR-type domain-containing protein n=1 Tax=Paraburkholderia ginsengiterrae TaxID=1462993 RepID=A0A1A9N264_9BURK|nr:LysR family transcriptional regulator [Paraburkholderia ginsengiterrae]OAJ56004.1 hypothetical protein A6V37_32340 [Paraburkholderia ginsengiterrae]OAJ58610.1 hypothetical protein A6V36_30280 [Paraburkholderia ginsengiterrae]
MPPLISLAYFEAAARTGSFAIAAKELHVTPAAISQQIKALEESLGIELFVRQHRKVSITPAARRVLPLFQEGFGALSEAVEELRAAGDEKSVVTVCAEPLFATKWLVPRLHRFYARFPEAEVRLQASVNSIDTSEEGPISPATFARTGVDLSIRFGYGHYSNLETTLLFTVMLGPVMSPNNRTPLPTLKEISKQPLLTDSATYRSPERFGWPEWLQHMGYPAQGKLREQRFGNGLLSLEATLTGQGVLLTTDRLVRSEIQEGKLVAPFGFTYPCPFSYNVVCSQGVLDREIVKAFYDWLVEESVA